MITPLISIAQMAQVSKSVSTFLDVDMQAIMSPELLNLHQNHLTLETLGDKRTIYACRTIEGAPTVDVVKALIKQLNDMFAHGIINGLVGGMQHFTISGVLSNRYVAAGRGAVVWYCTSDATNEQISNYKYKG